MFAKTAYGIYARLSGCIKEEAWVVQLCTGVRPSTRCGGALTQMFGAGLFRFKHGCISHKCQTAWNQTDLIGCWNRDGIVHMTWVAQDGTRHRKQPDRVTYIDQRCCDCIMVNIRSEISTSHIMVGYVLSVSQRPTNACTSPSKQWKSILICTV